MILLSGKRDSTDDMHVELNLLWLQTGRDIHLQCINHENIHGSGSLSKLLTRRTGPSVQHTRHINELTLFVPRMKMKKSRYTYSNRGPDIWNRLESHVKSIENFDQFKSAMIKRTSQILDNHPT